MVVSAVAQVLEHMVTLGKRCLADPVGPLAAHMGVTDRFAVHPLHHIVTADARIGARALGQFGRAVVRASSAEIGQAAGDLGRIVRRFGLCNGAQARLHTLGAAPLFDQHLAQHFGHMHGLKTKPRRKQLFAPPVLPIVALVPAIDAPTPPVIKDRFLDLHLDQLALFLDHDDQLKTFGKFVERLHVQRPNLTHLVGRDAQPFGLGLVDIEQFQRMGQIQPVLAGRHKSDLGPGFAPDASVNLVGPRKRLGGKAFVVNHAGFLRDTIIDQPDVQPPFGHWKVRHIQGDTVRPPIHHRGNLYRVLHQFQPGPNTRKPRQTIAINAEIQDFLHTGRRQDRHIGIHHRPIGLVQCGRAFAGVVIAHRHQNAAVGRGARHIGMAHHIARPVHTRALAIPQAKHAIELAFAAQFGLLRPPQCGGRQILIQARLEQDITVLQLFLRAVHLQIDGTDG